MLPMYILLPLPTLRLASFANINDITQSSKNPLGALNVIVPVGDILQEYADNSLYNGGKKSFDGSSSLPS